MATTISPTKPGIPVPPPGGGSGPWGDGGSGVPKPLPPGTEQLGMWLALASISMLFLGLTSAYVVRQGMDTGWRKIPMPPLLVVNTIVLLASSGALEWARKAWKSGRVEEGAFRRRVLAAFLLGALFVAGQTAAWRQLAASGIHLATNPHGSFFYTLTGLHGLHLLGGMIVLARLAFRVWRDAAASRRWFEVTALYWHFMDGLWLYLLILLFGLS